jgi:hypothetical protein
VVGVCSPPPLSPDLDVVAAHWRLALDSAQRATHLATAPPIRAHPSQSDRAYAEEWVEVAEALARLANLIGPPRQLVSDTARKHPCVQRRPFAVSDTCSHAGTGTSDSAYAVRKKAGAIPYVQEHEHCGEPSRGERKW